jgi:hypothetical protein
MARFVLLVVYIMVVSDLDLQCMGSGPPVCYRRGLCDAVGGREWGMKSAPVQLLS